MSNVSAKKVFIQIESASEQEEHIKNQRKTFKVLQGVATDKENLTGRSPALNRLGRLKALSSATLPSTPEYAKRKKVDTRPAETQTTPGKDDPVSSTSEVARAITVVDLTSDNSSGPGEVYWEHLAEKRREALEEALNENQRLHERVEGLEEELDTSKQVLDEARSLIAVLTEMLNDGPMMKISKNLDNADSDNADSDNADRSESNTSTSTELEQAEANTDETANAANSADENQNESC